jgi:magnesium-transporting ATPase (P-type)
MEHPNKLIDTFSGTIDLQNTGRSPVHANNILLRGCVLRNTGWALGVVVNTGHDTKIMMSSNKKIKSKTSNLESKSSKQILKIIILLVLLCFTGATGQAIWNKVNNINQMWYLKWEFNNSVAYWFIDFFYFFLLHATYIPVSLYVSMSIIRFFQSYLMKNDLEMYFEESDTQAVIRTMTLNEDLGFLIIIILFFLLFYYRY